MNELPNYDTWKLAEPPYYNDKLSTIGKCCICGNKIHDNDDYYDIDGEFVCDDCDLEYMNQFKKVGA